MSKEIYISSTPHETRLAIVEDEALTEIYYERENEYTLAGSIYNGRVTRVLPGMQSSFVDIGLERDAFLYITDFMEEAPDSEEFDTSSSSDRPPRQNGGERPAAARGEASASGRSSERGDRGGRGRRGGRDGDRDRNQDRNQEREANPDAASRQPTFDRNPELRDEAPAAAAGGSVELSDASELGEGAPGADGSRRWRGRRGRRRGRGSSAQPNGLTPENVASGDSEAPAYGEDGSAPERESYMEIDAAAADIPSAPLDIADSARRDQPRQPRDDNRNGQRRDGQRSDSPRRDRDRNPGRNPDRNRDRQQASRGFAPSRDLYGVDAADASGTGPISNAYPDADAGPAIESLILPGETLSKYRKGDPQPTGSSAQSALSETTVTLAPPANLYTIAAGWDGGAVLPGESLSRRRPSDSETGASVRSQRDFERNPRHANRDARSELRGQAPVTALPAAATEEPPVQRLEVPLVEAMAEPAAAPAGGVPAPLEAASPEAPQPAAVFAPDPPATEEEYEPVEASASYRVDLPRSEYRQSAPVLEPAAEEPPAVTAEVLTGPMSHLAFMEVPAPAAAALPEHDVTSISAAGEMFSEPADVLPEAVSHPAPMEVHAPASPIRHEGAILSGDASTESLAPGFAVGGFAPGSGQLAEEILDDEDSDGATLHASSIEEIDDLEEETLEGAADLGTMLREMSIDHITRTAPDVEEEDDSEEDDLEEDDLDEDEEEDEEDDEEEDHEGFEIDDRPDLDQSGQSEQLLSEEEIQEQAARTGAAAGGEYSGQQLERQDRSDEQSDRAPSPSRYPGRDSDRRGGRRDGRRGRNDRDRGRSGRPGHSNGHGRASAQATNLPAISDLLKPGQEILVQIAKEPIAKKGARITSHIALPGRFLVFMPTVNHTGVSRKIESDAERRRLKEILLSEKGDASGGFIVRTAAEGASEDELRSDLRFLLNLWADIKARSDSSKSPALIYHDLNLVERILRDQVTDNFSAIWVDTEDAYERVLRFLQRFQPSLIRRVKLYLKDTPLFEQFGITEEINKALRSKVWLKSGGSIVINQTEALVAIDINTGKFVGKTARLEDTIVKTNLDAIPEIVRQIRLRDLGGIIIIDFIDMDERKNRNRVMAALEDELKSDRAPSKVLQFNDFGLVAITRKRVKQSLERTLSTTCATCQGTGMVKSPVTVCNDIYIEMRKMHKLLDRGDVMLRVHPEVVKQLKSSGAKWLQEMEEMVGKTILVKSDPTLHPEQFDIH
jgi:ribonuclease G